MDLYVQILHEWKFFIKRIAQTECKGKTESTEIEYGRRKTLFSQEFGTSVSLYDKAESVILRDLSFSVIWILMDSECNVCFRLSDTATRYIQNVKVYSIEAVKINSCQLCADYKCKIIFSHILSFVIV